MSFTWIIVTVPDRLIRRHVIVDTIAALMHANLLEVFNERDHERRRAAIARTYADDIRWTDDDGIIIGRDALDAKAIELQGRLGDLEFVVAGPTHQTRGLGFLAFQLVEPGGNTPVSSGFDVAIVRDGVIAELYTVLTDPPR
jgi:SnoaL-like domain